MGNLSVFATICLHSAVSSLSSRTAFSPILHANIVQNANGAMTIYPGRHEHMEVVNGLSSMDMISAVILMGGADIIAMQ